MMQRIIVLVLSAMLVDATRANAQVVRSGDSVVVVGCVVDAENPKLAVNQGQVRLRNKTSTLWDSTGFFAINVLRSALPDTFELRRIGYGTLLLPIPPTTARVIAIAAALPPPQYPPLVSTTYTPPSEGQLRALQQPSMELRAACARRVATF
jgi:hypothetical protein